ncbi:hypothetical protein [uncultured Microbacterium sp.]|uniref:hypothetical protein n=1 Tax=uncultured Microbacterium sp. TaxID=191216 RepID=UPI0026279F41|nr:hypothetical protein [uncultured Microbacterium sp.]
MAKELSPQEAIERAQRAMEDRLTSIRKLAESRQALADTREASAARIAEVEREEREKVAAAERDDARAYSATLDAGWTPAELRKIGFAEAAQKRKPRARTARQSTPTQAVATPPADAATSGDEGQSYGD